jgi:hypothetical protein
MPAAPRTLDGLPHALTALGALAPLSAREPRQPKTSPPAPLAGRVRAEDGHTDAGAVESQALSAVEYVLLRRRELRAAELALKEVDRLGALAATRRARDAAERADRAERLRARASESATVRVGAEGDAATAVAVSRLLPLLTAAEAEAALHALEVCTLPLRPEAQRYRTVHTEEHGYRDVPEPRDAEQERDAEADDLGAWLERVEANERRRVDAEQEAAVLEQRAAMEAARAAQLTALAGGRRVVGADERQLRLIEAGLRLEPPLADAGLLACLAAVGLRGDAELRAF